MTKSTPPRVTATNTSGWRAITSSAIRCARAQPGGHVGGTRSRRNFAASGRGIGIARRDAQFQWRRFRQRLDLSSAATTPPTPLAARSAATRAAYRYMRHSEFSPEVAAAFGRGLSEDLQLRGASPRWSRLALYAANRRKWSRFEAELGLRLDAQHYERERRQSHAGESTAQPALRLRATRCGCMRSVGRFTQAQHVEEWRVEEAQQSPDSAQVSIHSILGLEFDTARWRAPGARGVQQTLDDRRAVFRQPARSARAAAGSHARSRARVPQRSEATGLELSMHKPISDSLHRVGHADLVARGR